MSWYHTRRSEWNGKPASQFHQTNKKAKIKSLSCLTAEGLSWTSGRQQETFQASGERPVQRVWVGRGKEMKRDGPPRRWPEPQRHLRTFLSFLNTQVKTFRRLTCCLLVFTLASKTTRHVRITGTRDVFFSSFFDLSGAQWDFCRRMPEAGSCRRLSQTDIRRGDSGEQLVASSPNFPLIGQSILQEQRPPQRGVDFPLMVSSSCHRPLPPLLTLRLHGAFHRRPPPDQLALTPFAGGNIH